MYAAATAAVSALFFFLRTVELSNEQLPLTAGKITRTLPVSGEGLPPGGRGCERCDTRVSVCDSQAAGGLSHTAVQCSALTRNATLIRRLQMENESRTPTREGRVAEERRDWVSDWRLNVLERAADAGLCASGDCQVHIALIRCRRGVR